MFEDAAYGSQGAAITFYLFRNVLVEAAGAIAVGINGHVGEPRIVYALGQVGGYQRVHKRRSLVGRYLDARKVPMGAAAYLGKACVHKRILGMLDGSKLFGSDGLVVGDAACKARVRGFVPGWKAKLVGQGANIGFR